jgi:hypothetical protein
MAMKSATMKSATKTKPKKLPKPRVHDRMAYWEHWDGPEAFEAQCRTPQGLADFRFALAAEDLDFPNLIPGRDEAPEFRLADETETAADRKRFEEFLDKHFPRSEDRFANLRRVLDRGEYKGSNVQARSSTAWVGYKRVSTGFRVMPHIPLKKMTAIGVYCRLVEDRKRLREMSRGVEYYAMMTGQSPPPLRICDCGLLFLASRPNVKWHSKACGSRVRMAKARDVGKTKDYEVNSQQKKADKEYEQKQEQLKAKAKGAKK